MADKEERVYYDGNKYRYPDITAKRDGETIYIQVGKSKSNGDPIAREARAKADLEATGRSVFFYAYDYYD